MPDNTKRRNFLERLLGREQAGEFEKSLSGLQRVLNAAGVQSKEHKTKGLMEDMASEVDGLLANVTDDETVRTALRNDVIAVIMGRLASAGEGEPEVEEPAPEMDMATDEEEEDKPPMMGTVMELSAQVKALASDNTAMVKDFQELMPVLMDAMKAVSALAPLAKEAGAFTKLDERLTAIEKALSGKPRQASKDAATEVIPSDTIKQEVEKGTAEQRVVLGVPITREVKYDR